MSAFESILKEIEPYKAQLVAVSKLKMLKDIELLYDLGQRNFGENYVQEFLKKELEANLTGLQWHFIGHLQRNKVRSIVGKPSLIHSVDSVRLLQEINKESERAGLVSGVLLQVHVATEETKSGFEPNELLNSLSNELGQSALPFVKICGLMAMASNTEDKLLIRSEFRRVKSLFDEVKSSYLPEIETLSMGMSSDYKLALDEGSTMLRIGSLLFGNRA